jgi:ERCC4-type nuclease
MDVLQIDYLKIAKDLKLKKKFLYKGFNKYIFNSLVNKIYIDSREQTPFSFDCQTEIAGLKFGDYSAGLDTDKVLVVERKSANDFIGTMSKGYERFCREVEKARGKKSKVLMIVENDINYMLSYNYLPQFKWVKASPEFIFSRLRSVLQAFSNFQVLFCKDKNEASYFTRLTLSNPEMFKWDLQYLYDTKQVKK